MSRKKKTAPTFDHDKLHDEWQTYRNVVFQPDDIVEIRYISSSLKTISEWVPAKAIVEAIPNMLQRNQQGYNIYMGVGPRKAKGGASEADVKLHRTLVADFDKVDLRTVRDHLTHSDIPWPTLIVATGNGYHAYWQLEEPIEAGADPSWSDYQRGIIAELDEIADQRIKDAPRILRVPGTYNTKNMDNLILSSIVEHNRQNVYPLSLFNPVKDELPETEEEIELPEGKLDLHPSTLRKLKNFPQSANWNNTIFEVAVDMRGRNWPKSEAVKLIKSAAKPVGKANHRQMLSTIESAYGKTRTPVGWGTDDDEEIIDFTINQMVKGGPKRVRAKAKAKGEEPIPLVQNVIVLQKDDELKRHLVTASQIHRLISEGTGGWPRRINGELFVIHDGKIKFLKDAIQFFAWLQRVAHVYWQHGNTKVIDPRTKNVRSPITKNEFFEYLRMETNDYFGFEELPHEPPLENTFYAPIDLPESDGSALKEFLDHLNPETDDDRELMLAMLMTPGAGLPPGTRPAFILTSEYGRGTGKTTTAQLIADVWGGAITVHENEDWERVRARLLDDDAAGQRVVVIDNIRKRLASSGLEAGITASWMDGKKMYVGQARRRNDLTWIFTANNPALSTDLTDRGVPIKIGDAKHDSDFAKWRLDFLRHRRLELISDVLAKLRSEPMELVRPESRDRWSLWQDAVLSRLPDSNRLAKLIQTRRPQFDDDKDLASEILAHIEAMLEQSVGEDYHKTRYQLRSVDLMHLLTTGVKLLSRKENDSTRRFVPYLRTLCGLEPLNQKLRYDTSRHAFVYTGQEAQLNTKVMHFDYDPE